MSEHPPTVVFLHGLQQRPDAWHDAVLTLPDGWQAKTPWVPGLKPTDTEPFDLDRAADGIAQGLEWEGLSRVHVVGLSVGAAVAVRIASRHPDLVDRLVLVSGQGAPSKMMLKLQLAVMRRTPEQKFLDQGIQKQAAIYAFEKLAQMDLAADLRRVTAPTLIVHGRADQTNAPAATLLARGIKGATMETIDGGHVLNVDNPRGLNDVIWPFLTQ